MNVVCRFLRIFRIPAARRCLIAGATLFLLLACCVGDAKAQLCVQLNGATYTQSFNSMPSSGSSNNASSIPVGFAFSEAGGNITFAANDGDLATANTYSYGSDGSTDRALGEITSSTLQSTIGSCAVNNTPFALTSLSLSYTGEQWRLGAADGNSDRLDFEFSTDATTLTTGTWTPVDSLDFTSPSISGTVGARDGNAAANRTSKGPIAIIPATPIGIGKTFFMRWVPTNISGANDGLAIDDFRLTYTPFADFNLDGTVDGKDLLRWQRGFGITSGASISVGDGNKDGVVDALDLYIWQREFNPPPFAGSGSSSGGDALDAVPEPASAGLAALVALCLAPLVHSRRRFPRTLVGPADRNNWLPNRHV